MTFQPPFHATTIRGDAAGPRLLIVAGVHGDEFEPMVAVKRLIRLLRKQRLRGEVTLVPVLNRPAWIAKQRTGSDGLDLARTFPGDCQGSTTERIAAAANELIRQSDYLIDMHTGGQLLRLWPLAGYLLHPNSDILEQQRKMAWAFNLPVVWGTDPSLNGRTLSAARDANVPAIYVEYLGAAPFCREAVHALVDGCWQVITMLGMAPGEPAASRVKYWQEDGRAGAGHLQISQPAPHAGRFVATVELGEPVGRGQPLGWLHDLATDKKSLISAPHAGRVVCLAGSNEVPAGYGLAVIVDFATVEGQLP